jgi:hypothetical protein
MQFKAAVLFLVAMAAVVIATPIPETETTEGGPRELCGTYMRSCL